MSSSIRSLKKLLSAVSSIHHSGSFCVVGNGPECMPGLEVKSVGMIGLPISPEQAEKLKSVAELAPHGRGTETVLDTSVRFAWKLDPSEFRLANSAWEEAISGLLKVVASGLGLEGSALEAHLYNLLLYEEGGVFLPHRDTEKLKGMVATLVLTLPSVYSGGELVVRHEGAEVVHDGGGAASAFCTSFAAFYGDCEHEVRPLRSGIRLCLVYNITVRTKSKLNRAPSTAMVTSKIESALREWEEADDSPEKCAIILEHQYTRSGLSRSGLKGADRARAKAIADAAVRAGFRAQLALIELSESGSTNPPDEDECYGRRSRRRSSYYHEDLSSKASSKKKKPKYEMEEVFDWSLEAVHWAPLDKGTTVQGRMRISEEEVFPEGALRQVDPEESVSGYLGNEGLTLERTYCRAAVVLWPDAMHFRLLAGISGPAALIELKRLLKKAKSERARDLCRNHLQEILFGWDAQFNNFLHRPWQRSAPEPKSELYDLLNEMLDALCDEGVLRAYFAGVLGRDSAAIPPASVCTVIARSSLKVFRGELAKLVTASKTHLELQRAATIIELLCIESLRLGLDENRSVLSDLTKMLNAHFLSMEQVEPSPTKVYLKDRELWLEEIHIESSMEDWECRPLRELLASMLRLCLMLGEHGEFRSLWSFLQGSPSRFTLHEVQVPVLLELWKARELFAAGHPEALVEWVSSCRETLEGRTRSRPQPPPDLQRPSKMKCRCAECAELKRFLQNPVLRQYQFPKNESVRRHIESQVTAWRIDLTLETFTKTRPYILLCTKNNATHERELAKYERDRRLLESLESLPSSG